MNKYLVQARTLHSLFSFSTNWINL